MKTPRRSGDARFRPDLEGLRGIAILLVVLCHVRLPGAEAGFVGVDVFFVLSGFLITGLLVEDGERTGRIRLGAFYARRVRRILPAAVVVLASTLLAAQLLLSPLDLPRVADDGLAASLSLANVRFALDATDYFAPIDASPLLHYWSLAVEEQFYLLWPVLLLIVARLGRPRVAMIVLATVILVGSFLLCLAITASSEPWAYYSLPTRAWELAAGGLLALAAPWYRLRGPVAAVLGWFGVGLLAAALVAIHPTTDYPGLAALLPTLGAVAIIASGGKAGSPGSIVLARAPIRWLGRVSYSLYLWHWPVLVLGPVALGLAGTEDGAAGGDVPVRLGLLLLAVVLATLTWRFVEEPFRRARLSRRGGRARGFALAGAAVLMIVVGSTTIGVAAAGDVDAVLGQDIDQDPTPGVASAARSLAPSPTVSASSTARAAGPSNSPAPGPTSTSTHAPAASARPSATASPLATASPSLGIEGPVPRERRANANETLKPSGRDPPQEGRSHATPGSPCTPNYRPLRCHVDRLASHGPDLAGGLPPGRCSRSARRWGWSSLRPPTRSCRPRRPTRPRCGSGSRPAPPASLPLAC